MKRLLALLIGCTLATGLFAAEDEIDTLRATLAKRLPDVTPDSIAPSPVPGLYELVIGTQVVYITGDGRLALQGRLLDLEQGTDLTEPVISAARLKQLASMPEEKMVIFEPEGEVKHTLTTFTDIDCPYCRRLHAEMDQRNASGIRVRYLLYPRAGPNTESFRKAVDVWCAEDRNEAMTRAKAGQPVPRGDCANPVLEHMQLGVQLGLTCTPYSITETGETVSGYAPAPELAARLDGLDPRTARRAN
jgi:thiol:disulfide interchange protein DsbC